MTYNDQNANTTYSMSVDVSSGSCKGDTVSFDYTTAGTISETGSSEDYMPPYMTVYCWQRTA